MRGNADYKRIRCDEEEDHSGASTISCEARRSLKHNDGTEPKLDRQLKPTGRVNEVKVKVNNVWQEQTNKKKTRQQCKIRGREGDKNKSAHKHARYLK